MIFILILKNKSAEFKYKFVSYVESTVSTLNQAFFESCSNEVKPIDVEIQKAVRIAIDHSTFFLRHLFQSLWL